MDELLEMFVGEWELRAVFSEETHIPDDTAARAVFEPTLDGAFLLERSEIDHPDAPDGLCIYARKADGDGYTQHYFDSRGIVRIYDMTFDGRTWTLTRERPDFTPLDFKQRYIGTFDDDGRTIRGAWESCYDGSTWQKDFDLDYVRTR
ncbi:MAG TPA: hypothetical protein VG868_02935 [Casimicrobiaceae bacterium]|nr:hypothetical protein [Casimicrobiaceae bacterium]